MVRWLMAAVLASALVFGGAASVSASEFAGNKTGAGKTAGGKKGKHKHKGGKGKKGGKHKGATSN